MELTAASLAAELKRQIDKKLPANGKGGNSVVVKASVSSKVSTEIYFAAVGILLEQLATELPEWEIGLEGEPDDLEITFTR